MSAGAAVVPAALLSAQDSGTTSRWKKKFHAAPGDSSSPPRGIGGDAGQQEELLHSKRPLGFSRRLDFVSADAHASVSPRPSSLGEAPGEAGCFEFSCWTKTLKMPGQRETSLQREAASPRRPHERALEAGLSSPAPQPDSTGTRGAGDSSGGVAESALPRPPASPLSSSGTGAAAAENSASLSGDAAEAKTLGGGRASPASSSAPIRQTAASSSSSLSAPQPPPPQTRKSSQTAATVRTALAAKTSSLLQRKQQFYKFAHAVNELRESPDLRRTSLCPKVKQMSRCSNKDCPYAHQLHELRATGEVYKTALCVKWQLGRCTAGPLCRHAHGEKEMRVCVSTSSHGASPTAKTIHASRTAAAPASSGREASPDLNGRSSPPATPLTRPSTSPSGLRSSLASQPLSSLSENIQSRGGVACPVVLRSRNCAADGEEGLGTSPSSRGSHSTNTTSASSPARGFSVSCSFAASEGASPSAGSTGGEASERAAEGRARLLSASEEPLLAGEAAANAALTEVAGASGGGVWAGHPFGGGASEVGRDFGGAAEGFPPMPHAEVKASAIAVSLFSPASPSPPLGGGAAPRQRVLAARFAQPPFAGKQSSSLVLADAHQSPLLAASSPASPLPRRRSLSPSSSEEVFCSPPTCCTTRQGSPSPPSSPQQLPAVCLQPCLLGEGLCSPQAQQQARLAGLSASAADAETETDCTPIPMASPTAAAAGLVGSEAWMCCRDASSEVSLSPDCGSASLQPQASPLPAAVPLAAEALCVWGSPAVNSASLVGEEEGLLAGRSPLAAGSVLWGATSHRRLPLEGPASDLLSPAERSSEQPLSAVSPSESGCCDAAAWREAPCVCSGGAQDLGSFTAATPTAAPPSSASCCECCCPAEWRPVEEGTSSLTNPTEVPPPALLGVWGGEAEETLVAQTPPPPSRKQSLLLPLWPQHSWRSSLQSSFDATSGAGSRGVCAETAATVAPAAESVVADGEAPLKASVVGSSDASSVAVAGHAPAFEDPGEEASLKQLLLLPTGEAGGGREPAPELEMEKQAPVPPLLQIVGMPPRGAGRPQRLLSPERASESAASEESPCSVLFSGPNFFAVATQETAVQTVDGASGGGGVLVP